MSFYRIPGKYSERQIAVIEKFCPLYAPDAKVFYLSDALDEAAIYEKEQLEQLGVSATASKNLPDIILYNEAGNQLYLIEAGISHRVVTYKRRHELEELFRGCSTIRIYVSVFLNLPHLDSRVDATRGNVRTVGRPRHTVHMLSMAFVDDQGVPIGRIPDLYRVIPGS